MKKINLAIILVILISFIIGGYFYFRMPARMASHWNIQGQADDSLPKFWGLFLMPIISVAIFLLFLFLPKIDPLKANVEEFRQYFDGFILLMTLFLFYIYLLTLFWNLGFKFNMSRLMSPALAALLYYCGVLTAHAKRNWFIGIRTPWTLSSDSVWAKTHQIGGKLFKAAGVIAILGIILPDYAFYFIFVPALFAAIYSFAYSYFEYRKEGK